MNFKRLIILSVIGICCVSASSAIDSRELQRLDDERLRKQRAMEETSPKKYNANYSIVGNAPELAEKFVKQIIQEFVPDSISTKFHEIRAPFISLYHAYVVNCSFSTKDAYGQYQKYNVQVKVKINSDNNGELYFEDFDWSEL